MSQALESEISHFIDPGEDAEENIDDFGEGDDEEIEEEEEDGNAVASTAQVFGAGASNIWQQQGRKRTARKARTGKTAGKLLPPEISGPLAEAQEFYIQGNYSQAVELLSAVTRLAPRLPDPFLTMGMIYEESGDTLQAIQFYVLAAELTPKGFDLWKKISLLAAGIGERQQSLEAVQRALRIRFDGELCALRTILCLETKRFNRARSSLNDFLANCPEELDFLVEYGNICQANGLVDWALGAFIRFVYHCFGVDDLPATFVEAYGLQDIQTRSLHVPEDSLLILHAVRNAADLLLERHRDQDMELRDALIVLGSCASKWHTFSKEGILSDDVTVLLAISLLRTAELSVERRSNLLHSCTRQLRSALLPHCDIGVGSGVPIASSQLVVVAMNWLRPILDAPMETFSAIREQPSSSIEAVNSSSSKISLIRNQSEAEGGQKADLAQILEDQERTKAHWEQVDFLFRQRIRIVESCYRLGMSSFATKTMDKSIVELELQCKLEEELLDPSSTLRPTFSTMLSKLWRRVAFAWVVLEQKTKAMVALKEAIQRDEDDPQTIYHLTTLAKEISPESFDEAVNLLAIHLMKWLGKLQPCWLQTQSDQQLVVAQAKVAEEADDDGSAEAFAQVEGFDLDRAVTNLSSNEISTVKLAWDLRSFILWADVLREQNDLRSYLCVMLPVLISWAAYPNEPNSSSELIPIAKDRKTYQVEIRQLSKAADRFYSNRSWLDNTNNSVSRVVACLCCYVHVEATIGLDTLFDQLQLVQETLLSVLGPGNSESAAIAAQCAEKINKIQSVNYQRGAGIQRPLHGDLEEDLRPRKRQKPVTMDCFDLGSDESQAVQLLGEARREAGAVVAVTATSMEPSSGGRKSVLTDLEVTFVTAAQAISPGVGAIAAAFICDPKNISLANSLYRLARIAPELNRFGLNVIERTLPVNRLASQHPNSIPANLLAGHELLSRRKLAEGIDKYIEAYQLDPTQPLTNLCLAVLFLHLSLHPLVLERREVLVKALVFLEEYRKYRKQRDPNLGLRHSSSGKPITGSSEMITEAALAQETFYNVGRAFHQLSLNSLAEKNYRQALQLEEEHPELKQSTLKVTAAAAMNLVLIYKKSQSPNLALEVIEKYLTF